MDCHEEYHIPDTDKGEQYSALISGSQDDKKLAMGPDA